MDVSFNGAIIAKTTRSSKELAWFVFSYPFVLGNFWGGGDGTTLVPKFPLLERARQGCLSGHPSGF
eukprot:2794560-Amphidinium_carterae.1